jgi:hypothetical protein
MKPLLPWIGVPPTLLGTARLVVGIGSTSDQGQPHSQRRNPAARARYGRAGYQPCLVARSMS